MKCTIAEKELLYEGRERESKGSLRKKSDRKKIA